MPQDLLKIYDGRNNFWQWDTGQKLIVLDNSIDQVHFSNNKMTYAIVKEVYENDGVRICEVPDIMLKTAKPLMAYAYVMEDNQNKTICVVRYSVNARPIPEDYTYEETNRFKDLVDKIEAVEDMIESGEGVKRFANIKEAEQWAEESQEVGLIISVKIDSKWIAHIIDSDHSIAKVYDNSDLITYINRLENLIGDESVADQIKNAIDVLDLENSYESKGAADKILIDAKEYAYKLVENHTVETQRAIEEEAARAKKEEEALVKTIHQVNDRISNIEDETIRDLSNRITGVEAVMDDKITEAISLIMDNPDEAINSINELIDLIKDSSEENIVVDSTLSKEGQAADAKAVGEALADKVATPASATIGQTIIVKTVDENGKPTEWEAVDMPEQVQGDWEQTVPNAVDYVKNRTHGTVFEVLAEFRMTGKPAVYTTSKSYKDTTFGLWRLTKENAGQTFILDICGQRLNLVAKTVSNGYWGLENEDGSAYGVWMYFNTSDDYKLTLYNPDHYFDVNNLARTIPVKIGIIGSKQLDEKFIPDTIARKTEIDEVKELIGDAPVSEQINDAISTYRPDYTNDIEIIDMLVEEDMLQAIADSDGAILTDENNNILTW